jgi:hypothetical protein
MTADQAKDGSFAFRYLPKATVEQAPQFAGALAAAKTGARLGSFLGPKGALVGGLAGPVIFEAIQALGPIAKERAQNDGRETPNAKDFNTAMASAAGMGILNTLAPASTGTLRRAVIETVTEGGQSGIEQTGSTIETQKGLTIDPRQIVGEGIIGGTSAGLVDTTLSTAQRLVGRKDNAPVSDRESQAQADFARRLTAITEDSKRGSGPNYDLRDVDPDSRSGAKQVIDSAHSDMAQELKTLIGTLKDRLKPQKTDLLDQILEKSDAALAAVKAKNKVKNVVEPRDFDAFEKLTGDLMEGQRAINLMHEMNELTRVYSEGLTGGVSRFTDALAPLGALDNYSNTGGVMQQFARPLATAALAMSNPGLAAAQVGTYATGRAIDALTGRRSRVRSYVRANERGPGQPTPTGRSITDEKAQEQRELERLKQAEVEEKERRAREEAENAKLLAQTIERQGQQGMPLPGNHPLMISLFVLGDQDTTVEDVLEIAEQFVDNSDPIIAKAAQDLIASRTQRLNTVENLSPLISEMKKSINPDTQFWINKERQIAGAATSVKQDAQQNLSQKQINYNRGIQANQNFAEVLKASLAQDSEVSPLDKALITSSLTFVQSSPITKDPVARMQAELENLAEKQVSQEAIQKYFLPYVERVQDQQGKSAEVEQAAKVIVDQNAEQFLPATAIDSPNVIGIYEGTEVPPAMSGKREVATYLQNRALEKLGGRERDLTNEGDRQAIADDMAAEAIYEMNNANDANFEWYDSVIEQMTSMMALKHPELNTDSGARTALLVNIAITSQNLSVPENLRYGEEAYAHFAKTGRFIEKKYGSKGPAILQNFKKANALLDELGSMQAFEQFLSEKFSVRDLNKILQQHLKTDKNVVTGELIDAEVYGSAIFGPKIGNGFYTNLRGDFTPVTMDMWLMRTLGRLQGKVLAYDPAKFANQKQTFKNALGRKRMSEEQIIAKARAVKSKHESD